MTGNGRARILEICSYPPPHAGWGVRVAFVRRHLEASGHHCQVLNTGKSRRLRGSDYLDVQNGLDYLRKVIRHARKGFLIHTHVNGDSIKGLILALVAEIVSVLIGRSCVLTFHAGPEQRYFPRHRSRLMTPLFVLAFALPRRIICNSNAVKEKIRTYGIRGDKIVAIPAFSQQYLAFEEAPLAPDLREFLTRHEPVLVSYIFLRPEFFVDSLLRALRHVDRALPRMGVVLVGGDTRSDAMTALIDTAKLKHVAYQAGDLSHDQFMTLLSKANLFVRTPKKDGVSSSVLEALAVKVPVIASENGARPPGVTTFKAGDAADLAQKVLSVWRSYPAVCSELVPPAIRDTVEDEAKLLLKLAVQGSDQKAQHEDAQDVQRQV